MVAFEGRSADGGADGGNEEGVQKQEGEHETEVVQQKGVLKEVLEDLYRGDSVPAEMSQLVCLSAVSQKRFKASRRFQRSGFSGVSSG